MALSQHQWSAVHDVFANYNQGDDETFVVDEENINGLVSEILIALELALASNNQRHVSLTITALYR
ncbi:hypothetical protein [Pseudomonas sp. B28(2017)]|uniref:hypothetical protein n=1 Tax=Pseudomonas sp. B28(2017) TaxID=1981730 RepID=UPI000A1F1742|nr:hypothetical protein [Pseudomonas sp. B28(2017)]